MIKKPRPAKNSPAALGGPAPPASRASDRLTTWGVRLLLVPARGPARLMTAGLGMVTNALTRLLGTDVLRDMQTFVAAFDTLFGGFRQRAQKTYQLLQADGTAFLVVAAPEPDALREAAAGA